MKEDLMRLAERCEHESSEGEREMLGEAAYAIWGDEAEQPPETLRDFWDRATHFIAKLRAFAFTDAALMLVPYDCAYETHRFLTKPCSASIYDGMRCIGEATGATPALALCAAALRARAAAAEGEEG